MARLLVASRRDRCCARARAARSRICGPSANAGTREGRRKSLFAFRLPPGFGAGGWFEFEDAAKPHVIGVLALRHARSGPDKPIGVAPLDDSHAGSATGLGTGRISGSRARLGHQLRIILFSVPVAAPFT